MKYSLSKQSSPCDLPFFNFLITTLISSTSISLSSSSKIQSSASLEISLSIVTFLCEVHVKWSKHSLSCTLDLKLDFRLNFAKNCLGLFFLRISSL